MELNCLLSATKRLYSHCPGLQIGKPLSSLAAISIRSDRKARDQWVAQNAVLGHGRFAGVAQGPGTKRSPQTLDGKSGLGGRYLQCCRVDFRE